ncbi:MAG: hypothetical protein Q4F49_10035 [Pseudoxanthomonas suwonensis]|nr:hypothetical protein [Pseudoxanthomonas suwonensis]
MAGRSWLAVCLALALSQTACANPPTADPCAHDREAMLALDEAAFDQDMTGGWRVVASVPGCQRVAADLIADWRRTNPQAGGIVSWHEGQLRAGAGQYPQAAILMAAARKPPEADKAGWNAYVDASVAFLQRDRDALLAARERLQAVPWLPTDGMQPPVDGIVAVTFDNGQSMRMRWPPNIDVVDGLIACFDRPYDEAYGTDCRPPLPPAKQ